MTDKWLAILNDGGNRVICQRPNGCFSMAQLRWQINRLQESVIKKGYRKWVLYDDDGFQFICGMFALLALGRRVLVPASRSRAAIKSMLGADTGLIGNHSELQKYIDVKISRNKRAEDFGTDTCVVPAGNWGQISFCTSGSSGQPKVVTKSPEQLYLEAEAFNNKWQPTSSTLFIPLVTHLHIYGLIFAFLLPLLARAGFYLTRNGGLLGVVEPMILDPRRPINELVVVTSPTIGRQTEQIRMLAEPKCIARDDRPAPISRVLCAGGKLTGDNAGRIIKLFDCPVTEIFGSTETGAVATREHQEQCPLNHEKPWQLLSGLDGMVAGSRSGVETGSDLKGEFSVWGGHVGGSREEPVMTGDEVKFLGHGRFELQGRNDQIFKIEGKRVSLHHLVEILEDCELITEAAVLPIEKDDREILLAGVVLSPQGKSRYRCTGKFATDRLIREHLLQFLDSVLAPRSIRYLEQMPRNEMGKLPQKVLVDILVNSELPTLPLIGDARVGRNELVFSLSIPMELRFLRGHFENRPIVPGVVLLYWVYHFIGEYWNVSMNPAVVNRLKFSKPTAPGDELTLVLNRIENGVEFTYQNELKKISSGYIPFDSEITDV